MRAPTPATLRVRARRPARRLATFLLALFAAYSGAVAGVLSIVIHLPAEVIGIGAARYEPVFFSMLAHGAACLLCAAAALGIRRRPACSARTARVSLLLCTLGALGSLELHLSVLVPPDLPSERLYRPHAVRGWTHIPGAEAILVGADGITRCRLDWHGLRIDETGPIEPIGEGIRVLSLGDSVGFGYYHPARVACVTQAVGRLNARRPGLNLIALNACVVGYDTHQEYDLLREQGFDLDPDLVILQFCLNDQTLQFDPRAERTGSRPHKLLEARPQSHWSGIGRALGWLGRRFHVSLSDEDVVLPTSQFSMQELLTTPPSERVQQAWRRTLKDLDGIVAACRARGVALVVVCFPIDLQLADASVSDAPQVVLRDACRARGVPFLDLRSVYLERAKAGGSAAREFLIDDCHPTRRGHDVAAEALAAFLEESGVVELLARRHERDAH